ncbi:TetR family transcriptional regulator [Luteipulveratus mongoliensis]|uniref:TetR family transcriptional regulator n=1 Tax=Luteipulveratus mongoliensis TaxID=571913 RepID=A0A0K1JE24_9MICO|nr:TetR family transcriptional regulator [Luteipulveratus mongoliensis]AKU14967.1 TetR family transcriptional regulator [Luteipulveratus mongoliensis]
MPSDPPGGLRELKKRRTRKLIRTTAFELFREQGYTQTTTEQIAAGAEVSPSTFFRYFPTKEALVETDDLDPELIKAFRRQPEDISVLAALRGAAKEVLGTLDEEDLEFERQRSELLRSQPELKGAVQREMSRTIDVFADMIAERTGLANDDVKVRATAGAAIGAFFALGQDQLSKDIGEQIDLIKFLEAGMPL